MSKRTDNLPEIQLQDGKKYIEVKERIKHLANNFEYSIKTKFKFIESLKLWIVTAKLTIIEDGKKLVYTASAKEYENKISGDVNNTSALENAETSAVGRACALAGIGISNGIASVEEMKAVERQGGEIKGQHKKRDAEIIAEIGPAPEGVKVGTFNAGEFLINNIKNCSTPERLKNMEAAFKNSDKYTDEQRENIAAEFKKKKAALKKRVQRTNAKSKKNEPGK